MDLQRALTDGEQFIKNAQDEMQRTILREDQLYFIDNQVEAIDVFLADTEDLSNAHPQLAEVRTRLRDAKGQLEKKSMEFLAKQEGSDLPEDQPPAEMAADLVGYGKEFIQMADEALKAKVEKINEVAQWEEPLTMINSFLADSEIFVVHNKDLPKVREQLKSRKRDLEKRVRDVVAAWRASDLAGGEDDEE